MTERLLPTDDTGDTDDTVCGMSDIGEAFEAHRPYLTGLAYRMLGSMSGAEDIVQDAFLRWQSPGRGEVRNTRAYLAKIVTRLCLDELKSARARREIYVGPWLPEPVLDATALSIETATEYAEDLSVGLLLALERLSPLERAAFLLHDVFDVGYGEVAEHLGRNAATCRQLAKRARENVRAARPRFTVSPEAGAAIAKAFAAASTTGDVGALARLLAEDVVFYSDGGGRAKAATRAVAGRDRVLRLLEGLARKYFAPLAAHVEPTRINGMPGFIMTFKDGSFQTTALEIVDNRISSIYVVRNPDKLAYVGKVINHDIV